MPTFGAFVSMRGTNTESKTSGILLGEVAAYTEPDRIPCFNPYLTYLKRPYLTQYGKGLRVTLHCL